MDIKKLEVVVATLKNVERKWDGTLVAWFVCQNGCVSHAVWASQDKYTQYIKKSCKVSVYKDVNHNYVIDSIEEVK